MLQTLRTRSIDESNHGHGFERWDFELWVVVVVFERAGICSTSQVAIWNQQRYNNVI
jgi:hypothetical protein